MTNENPTCPKCGSVMILQTARKGSFSGKKFYGCPNWRTTCKGVIVNIENENSSQTDNHIKEEQNISTRIPVLLNARERFEDYRVLFFQNMAIPKELLDESNKDELLRNKLLRFGQWRLDFPVLPTREIETSEDIKRVLLVAKKILTRGKITILSPFLEKKLYNRFSFNKFNLTDINTNIYFSLADQDVKTTAWFDGKKKLEFKNLTTEHYFYEKFLPQYLGSYYKRFVLPQVHFSSLIDNSIEIDEASRHQRADFLITTPEKSIIVELDDSGHEAHQSRDANRDNLLKQSGFHCIRIENQEIESGSGKNLEELERILHENKVESIKNTSKADDYLLAVKLAHQVQITIQELLLNGHISLDSKQLEIYFDTNSVSLKKDDTKFIIESALEDLNELIQKLFILYGIKSKFVNFKLKTSTRLESISAPVITFNENLSTKGARFIIQDLFFTHLIAHNNELTSSHSAITAPENVLSYFLKYIFRHDTFREGQLEAIKRVLERKDAIVLLPTGGGKSLAFQLASLILPGASIVVDPIVALIDDQKDNLKRIGIDRVEGITSQSEGPVREKLVELFASGEYIFCYIAPERLQNDKFRNSLKSLTVNMPISLIAIDEAHCVSEWGHDFRTAYLNIGRITREYCKAHNLIPPLLALTGTASGAVLRDIQRELQIKDFDAIITPKTFNRKELHFFIHECQSEEKKDILKSILKQNLPSIFNTTSNYFYSIKDEKTNCGILFCPHASGPYGVVENMQFISSLDIPVKFYSGKKQQGFSDNEWVKIKRKNADDFKNNKFSILVATKSFGMGIDKANIRFTIHLGLPNSIESFYQEVGRAGRDRNKAQSILIFSNDFKERTLKLLDPNATIDELNRIMEEERDWETDDDITRALWFHLNVFRGVKDEFDDIKHVIQEIGSIEKSRKVNIVFQYGNRNNLEKAVHRLLLLGIISDYTIDYATSEFRLVITGISREQIIDNFCRYVEGYNRGRVAIEKEKLVQNIDLSFSEFVHKAAETLIFFIYDTIEKGRRRAFREILSMSEDAVNGSTNQDVQIRERILRYLETTYSEEIQQVLDDVESFNNLKIIFDGCITLESGETIGGVRSPKDAAEIRGQVAHYLESYPDHPGLLFLRAISEIYCTNTDVELALQNIKAGCTFAIDRYHISKDSLYEILAWMLEKIYNYDKLIYENYVLYLMENFDDVDFERTFLNYPGIEEGMLYAPALYSINRQAKKTIKTLN